LHISYDHAQFFGRDFRIYGVKGGFGLMAYSMYTHAKSLAL
jgi:hypothetical protein